MILNVSGRTDIVAFYTKWFMNRYKEGYVDVRNPFNQKLVSRVNFSDVDGILFCTKNPLPIIKHLKKIEKPILFHITLTPYKKDIEPNVIAKGKIIEGIKKIANIIPQDNIYIRYDPILINDYYTVDYHIKAFNSLCQKLNGYVNHIIISFIDDYKNVRNNYKYLKLKELTKEDYQKIGLEFSRIAKENNMTVQTCCEKINLEQYGFIKEDCVSATLAFKLTGKTNFKIWKERNCQCISMVDIGSYNSCKHFCKYCYANYDEEKVLKNTLKHDINSSLLLGKINESDIIKIRR